MVYCFYKVRRLCPLTRAFLKLFFSFSFPYLLFFWSSCTLSGFISLLFLTVHFLSWSCFWFMFILGWESPIKVKSDVTSRWSHSCVNFSFLWFCRYLVRGVLFYSSVLFRLYHSWVYQICMCLCQLRGFSSSSLQDFIKFALLLLLRCISWQASFHSASIPFNMYFVLASYWSQFPTIMFYFLSFGITIGRCHLWNLFLLDTICFFQSSFSFLLGHIFFYCLRFSKYILLFAYILSVLARPGSYTFYYLL